MNVGQRAAVASPGDESSGHNCGYRNPKQQYQQSHACSLPTGNGPNRPIRQNRLPIRSGAPALPCASRRRPPGAQSGTTGAPPPSSTGA